LIWIREPGLAPSPARKIGISPGWITFVLHTQPFPMGIKNLRHPMEPQKTTSPLGCPIDHQGTEHSGRKVDLDRRTGTRLCFAHATFLYVNTEFASISPWIKSAWDIRTPCSFRSGTISEYEQTLYQPSSVSGWVSYCIFPSTIR